MPWAFDVNSGRYRNAPELAKRFRILASQRSDFNDRLTFAHYISATYADRFDSYSGEQPQVTGEQSYGTEVSVQTKIVKAKGISVTLNYRIRENAGSWQISDVYLDGTISQLATQRSGIPLDPPARRRRRSDLGAESQSRLADPKRGQGVITPHCVSQLAVH
jgi:hypothetical protein